MREEEWFVLKEWSQRPRALSSSNEGDERRMRFSADRVASVLLHQKFCRSGIGKGKLQFVGWDCCHLIGSHHCDVIGQRLSWLNSS